MKPYTDWEDWQHGMYAQSSVPDRTEMVRNAVSLLSSSARLAAAMQSVVDSWPVACDVNLASSPNNRAWIGQAACCIACGCTEEATRLAWGLIDESVRQEANRIADSVILQYRNKFRKQVQLEIRFDA